MADYRLHDRQWNAGIGGKGDEGVAKGVEGRLGSAGPSPFYLHARLDMRRLEDQLQPMAYSPLAVLVVVGDCRIDESRGGECLVGVFSCLA